MRVLRFVFCAGVLLGAGLGCGGGASDAKPMKNMEQGTGPETQKTFAGGKKPLPPEPPEPKAPPPPGSKTQSQ
jgi:hypothetical protein